MTEADTLQLPRYVRRYKLADGKYQYRFNPPQHYVAAGIVKRQQLSHHKSTMRAEAKRLNILIDEYNSGKVDGSIPLPRSKVDKLLEYFYTTLKFTMLGKATQLRYEAQLKQAVNTKVEGRRLGDIRLHDLTVRHCALAYEEWAKVSVTSANDRRRIFGILMNYAISIEVLQRNPIRYVQQKTVSPRRVRWTQQQVKAFLEAAYSNHETRNIGLIVHMSYEWCQRIGDMRMLTWDAIDLEAKTVTITQSKRGAVVYLPITEGLASMLIQQREDYGFQKYVAPRFRTSDDTWQAFTQSQVGAFVEQVKEVALLPKELQARDLRRTGITELIISGVDAIGVMQVSGHKNVASIKPYMVNTLAGATNALARRFALKEEELT